MGDMADIEEEWEIISHDDDAFVDDEDNKIILGHVDNSSISTVFNMNHFILPSSKSTKIAGNSVMANQKHNHQVPGEVMKENIVHASSLSNTGMEPEDTKKQDTKIKEGDRKHNVLKETKGAKILCKRTLGGLLAICSFAAIICIVILGKRWPHDQMLHFQIYTGDGKRKGMVQQSRNMIKHCQQQPEEIPVVQPKVNEAA